MLVPICFDIGVAIAGDDFPTDLLAYSGLSGAPHGVAASEPESATPSGVIVLDLYELDRKKIQQMMKQASETALLPGPIPFSDQPPESTEFQRMMQWREADCPCYLAMDDVTIEWERGVGKFLPILLKQLINRLPRAKENRLLVESISLRERWSQERALDLKGYESNPTYIKTDTGNHRDKKLSYVMSQRVEIARSDWVSLDNELHLSFDFWNFFEDMACFLRNHEDRKRFEPVQLDGVESDHSAEPIRFVGIMARVGGGLTFPDSKHLNPLKSGSMEIDLNFLFHDRIPFAIRGEVEQDFPETRNDDLQNRYGLFLVFR